MNQLSGLGRGRTPYFTGVEGAERRQAILVERRLADAHPQLRGFLFSAAAYLIRDGQPPNDARVVEEARRRKRYLDRRLEQCRRRREQRLQQKEAAA